MVIPGPRGATWDYVHRREMGHISATWEGDGTLLYGCVLMGLYFILEGQHAN